MANTALITGASSGIGMELARVFARHKTSLVLVARSEGKLQELAGELQAAHGVTVRVLAKDLAATDAAKEVYDWCRSNDLTIDYLVNNAGYGDHGLFADSNWEKQLGMIDLNITALTHLTRLFLPDMMRNKSGKIMNVASTAAFQPGPAMAVYCATKAYVLSFSEAIAGEVSGTGVTVTALCPGATRSGFQEAAAMQDSGLFKNKNLPSSAAVAEYGYKAMMRGKMVAIHGVMNYIMANSIRFVPRALVVKMAAMILR